MLYSCVWYDDVYVYFSQQQGEIFLFFCAKSSHLKVWGYRVLIKKN